MDALFMQTFQAKLEGIADLRCREIESANGLVTLFYLEDMCDTIVIGRGIVAAFEEKAFAPDKAAVMRTVLKIPGVGETLTPAEAVTHVLSGDSVLFFDFIPDVIYCETKKIATRAVEKSEIEASLKGSKESFNELISDNLSLVRKRLTDSALKIEEFSVGEQSKTRVAFLFLNGLAPADLVKNVRGHIQSLPGSFVFSQNDFAEYLSPRSTTLDVIGYTEKPDVLVSRLYEGRVAILVNGSSMALTAPHFFIENFHAADDYNSNRVVVNVVRLLRGVAFFIALLLPGFFIALSTCHFSLIPTTFILKLAVQRSGVPVPTVVEMMVLQFFFELAREAGKRLPLQIGQALSIVSALILGEAAVGAGVTSEATVVVIGVYAIGSFLNPKISGTTYVWSLFILLVSAGLGLFGFYLSFIVFLAHVSSLRSCGYPLLFPLGTPQEFRFRNKDLLFRGNATKIKKKVV